MPFKLSAKLPKKVSDPPTSSFTAPFSHALGEAIMLKQFKHLPQALQVMALAFVLAPLGFAAAFAAHLSGGGSLPHWYVVYLGVTYFVLPWPLAVLLVKRNAIFLAVFGAECVLLLAHLFIAVQPMPDFARYAHVGFALVACAMALMLVNRDLLFPFIFEKYRGFRQAPRVALNQIVTIVFPRLGQSVDVMIEDASLTGIAVYGGDDVLADLLIGVQRGDTATLVYRTGKKKLEIDFWYLWAAPMSGVVKLGFRAADLAKMELLFEALGFAQGAVDLKRRVAGIWGRTGVRRTLTFVLAMTVIFILALPLLPWTQAKPAKEAPTRPAAR